MEEYILAQQQRRKALGVRHNAKNDVVNDLILEHKKKIGLPPIAKIDDDPPDLGIIRSLVRHTATTKKDDPK